LTESSKIQSNRSLSKDLTEINHKVTYTISSGWKFMTELCR